MSIRHAPIRPLLSTLARHYSTPSQGKHAIITGASRGIGLATAHLLAAQGYTLTLIARDAPRLAAAASSLPRAATHRQVPGDVSHPSLWEQAIPKGSQVDALVNAAGVAYSAPFLRGDAGRMQTVIETNLLGTMWACRAAGRAMLRQRPAGGVLVCVGSLLGSKGGAGAAAYAASKAGVVGLTRALAAELGPSGVRVNAVLPGYVGTDMTDAMTDEARVKARAAVPLGRFGTPDEVADAVWFLVRNAYAHNCVLNLDGGLSAGVRLLYMCKGPS